MLDNLKPGDTVYTRSNHVSRSGMTHAISLYVAKDGDIRDISFQAAEIMRGKMHKKGGIKIGGCGMDMGFALVYNLGRYLFPDGFGDACCSDGCTYRPVSKDDALHCNDNLREDVTPHEFFGRNGDKSGWDNDGGYALNHRWL